MTLCMKYKMLEYDRIDISEGIDLIKQVHQKNVMFVFIGILKILVLGMSRIFVSRVNAKSYEF